MDKIKRLQEEINRLIAEQKFNRHPSELYEPVQYIMSLGGKRLRPLLTLLANELFEGRIEHALYPALAIEVFHNFTLVHDDIMDNAPIRRGHPTVHKKWNANIAILSGDTMFAMAYQYAVRTDKQYIPAILDVFSQTAIEVCEGQQLDLNFETSQSVSIAEYLEMIRLKTAVLLGACLKIGAITANAAAEDTDLLYNFGVNLGIAFQLKDDLLDLYGNEGVFGKVTGGDVLANKKTYLVLRALELASPEDRDRLLQLFDATYHINGVEKILEVKQIFDKYHIHEEVNKIMSHYLSNAFDMLGKVSAGPERTRTLKEFARYLYDRIS
ncbi:MAG: polyprenyl synthetase family protein [Bacteroidetes bacterium]|nr:polyprenyl synthetase family protein [Bacteroidota bacterium]